MSRWLIQVIESASRHIVKLDVNRSTSLSQELRSEFALFYNYLGEVDRRCEVVRRVGSMFTEQLCFSNIPQLNNNIA